MRSKFRMQNCSQFKTNTGKKCPLCCSEQENCEWIRGKGCDTFCPVGPWLVTKDEINDPQNLDVWLDVNGERVQSGNTNTMIFDVKTIVSYVSHFMTLEPGDLIATGTPPVTSCILILHPFLL